jgi:hypothetical protein
MPLGATISQGAGTNTILVDFSNTAVSGEVSVAGNNPCGTGTAANSQVTVMICTGIDQNQLQSGIVIHPNPVQGILNLDIKGKEKQLQAQITDVNGQNLYNGFLDNLTSNCSRQIDVSRFANGVYILRLESENRVYIGRFVVAK